MMVQVENKIFLGADFRCVRVGPSGSFCFYIFGISARQVVYSFDLAVYRRSFYDRVSL